VLSFYQPSSHHPHSRRLSRLASHHYVHLLDGR
jgi:hypothetical protein